MPFLTGSSGDDGAGEPSVTGSLGAWTTSLRGEAGGEVAAHATTNSAAAAPEARANDATLRVPRCNALTLTQRTESGILIVEPDEPKRGERGRTRKARNEDDA